ncbi:MAG: hypothetical protein ACLGGX_03650 [Bdellovibrionia bacterium]
MKLLTSLFLTLLLLSACAQEVDPESLGGQDGFGDGVVPAFNFSGTWSGRCEVVVDDVPTFLSCSNRMIINQTADSLSGLVTVNTPLLNDTIEFPSQKIVGNRIYDGDVLVGEIGPNSLSWKRDGVGSFSFEKLEDGSMYFEVHNQAGISTSKKILVRGTNQQE